MALFPCLSAVPRAPSEQALAAREATGRGTQMVEGCRWKGAAAGWPSGHGRCALGTHHRLSVLSARPIPAAHTEAFMGKLSSRQGEQLAQAEV